MNDEADFDATIRMLREGAVVFGRYRLERVLGRGGMGVVWLARDDKLEVEVALKFLPEVVALDSVGVDELKGETRRSRGLTHPNIVRIHDFLEGDGRAAITMEYVEGETLSELRKGRPGGVFGAEELRPWLKQLAGALDYAHEERVVHRDLKPGNVMVAKTGRLKVMDFGIAATLSETATRVSKVASSSGSPPYMSPQQMLGKKPTAADDVYAMGAMIYELMTGKPPFYRGNIYEQAQREVPPGMGERRAELWAEQVERGAATAEQVAGWEADKPIAAEWETVVAACLAKEPEGRPGSVGAVVEGLKGGRAEREGRIEKGEGRKGGGNVRVKEGGAALGQGGHGGRGGQPDGFNREESRRGAKEEGREGLGEGWAEEEVDLDATVRVVKGGGRSEKGEIRTGGGSGKGKGKRDIWDEEGEVEAPEVFVSHSSMDAEVAKAVVAGLEGEGVRCWMAPRDIRAGRAYGAEIVAGVKACRAMVVILTEKSNGSTHVAKEIERAVHHGLALVPVRWEAVEMSEGLEYFLSSEHWVEAHEGRREERVKKVVEAAKGRVAKQGERWVKRGRTEEVLTAGDRKAAEVFEQAKERRQAGRVEGEGKPGRGRWGWVVAALVLLMAGAGAGYYYGVHRPEQVRQAESARQEAERVAAEEARVRVEEERVAAEARATAEREQREYAVMKARIEALLEGAPVGQRDATEAAVVAYLEEAPEGYRAEIEAAWVARAAAWETARVAGLRGGLVVMTEPVGALVMIGALDAGPGPRTLREVRLGVYAVTVTHPGYEEWRGEVTVKENDFTRLPVVLTRATGGVGLETEPTGLDYVLSGPENVRREGKSPATMEGLPTGEYVLVVTREGFPEVRRTVRVERNARAQERVEVVGGVVVITSEPSGAEVFDEEGRRLGVTPLTLPERPAGVFEVELRLERYLPTSVRGTVRVRETARVAGRLTPLPYPQAGQAYENTLGMKFVPVPGTEVLFSIWETREQDYAEFVRATGHAWRSANAGATHPAVNVSWDDAQAFCRWLTQRERAEGKIGPEQSYRLPTDHEWSVAVGLNENPNETPEQKNMKVRGQYPWGKQWPPPRGAGNYAPSLNVDTFVRTAPVGSFAANRHGLHDLGGNVWEWVEDKWNPSPSWRVFRGASFGDGFISGYLLSSYRFISAPDDRSVNVGFRVVLAVGRGSVVP